MPVINTTRNGQLGEMNNFNTDLLYSLESNFDKTINEAYYHAFPHLVKINEVEDKERQMLGIDKELVFKNGNTVYVDEKKRRTDYGDILLEEYSNFETKRVGWLGKDKYTDYVVYVIMPSKKVYFLPFLLLQKVWLENYHEWLIKYGRKFADNGTYKTSSIPVPTEELLSNLKESFNLAN